jgi:hypothetical protein
MSSAPINTAVHNWPELNQTLRTVKKMLERKPLEAELPIEFMSIVEEAIIGSQPSAEFNGPFFSVSIPASIL